MSKLRKLLCAALVLAMALSLVVLPTNTALAAGPINADDYSDFDDISPEHLEAVDVLTAIGMWEGDDDDNDGVHEFKPQGFFTRAQAAKIMSIYTLGDAANRLPQPTVATFDDVPANHWASAFIAHVEAAGIMVGHGDGTFKPSDPVTSVQMVKMLLAASGYGARGELEGDGWAIETIRLANARDIFNFTNNTGDMSAPAQRELIANYVFKTLVDVGLVQYNELLGTYLDVDHNIFMPQVDYERRTQAVAQFRLSEYRYEQYDKYGLPGRIWRQNNRDITGFYHMGSLVAEFTAGSITQGDLVSNPLYSWNTSNSHVANLWGTGTVPGRPGYTYADLFDDNYSELDVVTGLTNNQRTTGLLVLHNGTMVQTDYWTDTVTRRDSTLASTDPLNLHDGLFGFAIRGGASGAFLNRGSVVRFYDLDRSGTVDLVVIIDEFLARVRSLSAGVATIEVFNDPGQPENYTLGSISGVTGLAVGDYIWIVPTMSALNTSVTNPGTPYAATSYAYEWGRFGRSQTSATYGATTEPIIEYGKVETVEGVISRATVGMGMAANSFPVSLTLTGGNTLNTPADHFIGKTIPANIVSNTDSVFYIGRSGYLIGYENKAFDYTAMNYLFVSNLQFSSNNMNAAGLMSYSDRAIAMAHFTNGNAKMIDIRIGSNRVANITKANSNSVGSGGGLVNTPTQNLENGFPLSALTSSHATPANMALLVADYTNKWYIYTENTDGTYSLRGIDHGVPVNYLATNSETNQNLAFNQASSGSGARPQFTIGNGLPKGAAATGNDRTWVATANTVLTVNGSSVTGIARFPTANNSSITGTYGWNPGPNTDYAQYRALAISTAPDTRGLVAGQIYVIDVGYTHRAMQLGILNMQGHVFNVADGTYDVPVHYIPGAGGAPKTLTLDTVKFGTLGNWWGGAIVDWTENANDVDDAVNLTTMSGRIIYSTTNRIRIAVGGSGTVAGTTGYTAPDAVVDVWYDSNTLIFDGNAFTTLDRIPAGLDFLGMSVDIYVEEPQAAWGGSTYFNALAMSIHWAMISPQVTENRLPENTPLSAYPSPPLGLMELNGANQMAASWGTAPATEVPDIYDLAIPNEAWVGWMTAAPAALTGYTKVANVSALSAAGEWTVVTVTPMFMGNPFPMDVIVVIPLGTATVTRSYTANTLAPVTAAVEGFTATAALVPAGPYYVYNDMVAVEVTLAGTATDTGTLTITVSSGMNYWGPSVVLETEDISVTSGDLATALGTGGVVTLTFNMPGVNLTGLTVSLSFAP